MRISYIVVFPLGITMATPSLAGAAFLVCVMPNYDGKIYNRRYEFTIDEDAREVSMFAPDTGYSETLKAIFTPDQVAFENDIFGWAINRREGLKISRLLKWINITDYGQCTRQPMPKKAF